MSNWIDWNDPQLSRVANRIIGNVQKIMSGDLTGTSEKPPPLIESGDYCKVDGPRFGVPRVYYGTVQSITDYGFANLCIENFEDPPEDPLISGLVQQKIARGMPLRASDLPPSHDSQMYDVGEIMTLPISCLQKVESNR